MMKTSSRSILCLTAIGATVLLSSCSKDKESTQITEALAQQIFTYEQGIFKSPDEAPGMHVSGGKSYEILSAHQEGWPKALKNFDNANPHDSVKKIMNDLIAYAANNKMAVRNGSWSIVTYGPSEEIEPYNDSTVFEYAGSGFSGSSGSESESKNCRDQYIQAKLTFGHMENASFIYSWDITYDVIAQKCRLTSFLHTVHPVTSPVHGGHLVNLTIK